MRPIQEALPHRAPFLFLDEVLELTPDKVVAQRTIRAEEPHFAGHYPGHPIMPGVLLCEAALQAGCYLMAHRMAGEQTGQASGVPMVTRMNDVKFKRVVRPGDQIVITAEFERSVMGAHFLKATIKSAGKPCASLTFCVVLGQASAEDAQGAGA